MCVLCLCACVCVCAILCVILCVICVCVRARSTRVPGCCRCFWSVVLNVCRCVGVVCLLVFVGVLVRVLVCWCVVFRLRKFVDNDIPPHGENYAPEEALADKLAELRAELSGATPAPAEVRRRRLRRRVASVLHFFGGDARCGCTEHA